MSSNTHTNPSTFHIKDVVVFIDYVNYKPSTFSFFYPNGSIVRYKFSNVTIILLENIDISDVYLFVKKDINSFMIYDRDNKLICKMELTIYGYILKKGVGYE